MIVPYPNALDGMAVEEWFAVYGIVRHEKRIAEHFHQRRIECFLPLYETQHRWRDGSKATVQLPLFPGYLFVRMVRGRRLPLLEVPGVLSIVGDGREGSSVGEDYIRQLREGIAQRRIEPH